MKAEQEIKDRIETLKSRIGLNQERREQALSQASQKIRENADHPMYVARCIPTWLWDAQLHREKIEQAQTELDILRWVIEE